MPDPILRDLVALNMTLRFGVADYEGLVAALGSHEALRKARISDLEKSEMVTSRLAREFVRLRDGEDPDEELRQTEERSVVVVPFTDPGYPASLRRTHNPPLLLYVQGRLEPADGVALAIVGTRHPTHYGATQAGRLASELASRGMTIVSGFARGIDTAVHRAALDAGGRTLGVLAGGLARLYPPENARLADEIVGHGALISEFPLFTPPLPPYFPRRNRIISGLALGVLVVEADRESGALITADWALEQGREVFALPGRVDQRSGGCHRLIQQGAKLVESGEDVLADLGDVGRTLAPARPREAPPALGREESSIVAALGADPVHIDAITDATGLPPQAVASLLMVLEIKKVVTQLPGKHFARR